MEVKLVIRLADIARNWTTGYHIGRPCWIFAVSFCRVFTGICVSPAWCVLQALIIINTVSGVKFIIRGGKWFFLLWWLT
jgi:hypothetical protein